MFGLFDLLYMAALAVSPTLNVYNDTQSEPTYMPKELGQAATIQFRPNQLRADAACRFKGIAVPYVRDWEEVTLNPADGTEYRSPPEPNKIASYAIIVYRKICPGVPDVLLNHADSHFAKFLAPGQGVHATAISTMTPETKPKWLDQALKRIEAAEATSPAAKEFLDFTRQESAKIAATAKTATPAAPAETAVKQSEKTVDN